MAIFLIYRLLCGTYWKKSFPPRILFISLFTKKKKSMHVRLFGKVGHLLHYTTLYGSWDVQLEATFFNKRKESNWKRQQTNKWQHYILRQGNNLDLKPELFHEPLVVGFSIWPSCFNGVAPYNKHPYLIFYLTNL